MDYPGKVIRKTPVTPTQASASGVWTVDDALQAVKTNTWPIAGVPNPISRSLRFNSADSATLTRTPASAGNKRTWTWSGWVKTSNIGSWNPIFSAGTSAPRSHINFRDTNRFNFRSVTSAEVVAINLETTPLYRDPSAWYHLVVALDTTQATAANRVKMYVNGQQITAFSTEVYPSQNENDLAFNAALQHAIGVYAASPGDGYFGGYQTEFNFIDGQQLTPSDFGLTDPQTGQWVPKKYTGTYGTNGFYLNFSDNSSTGTLGYDYSGNSNNFTANNFSVTAGAGNDSLVDVPTPWIAYSTTGDVGGVVRGNYCTLNPLDKGSAATLTNGNLDIGSASNPNNNCRGTFGMSSGKWYFEFVITSAIGGVPAFGIGSDTASLTSNFSGDLYLYLSNGTKAVNGVETAYGATFTQNDVIGVAFDADNNSITFYKNNSSQGAITGVTSGLTWRPFVHASITATITSNFGQRPFAYTPPAGFLSLCTTNLPTPTIGATSTTQAGKYFNIITWSGTNGARTFTGVGFQPDFVWGKLRNGSGSHQLYDAVRGTGASKALASNATDAEGLGVGAGSPALYGYLSAFTSDGFSVADGTDPNPSLADAYWNDISNTYVAWNWNAGGSNATNTSGSITSTVRANTTAGFSIVTYTGNGTSATVGHGLGVAPNMIIVKSRSATGDWTIFHSSLQTGRTLYFDTSAQSATGWWNNTAPTSTLFSLSGTGYTQNNNGTTYVAYCFAPVAGYSAFGSYTGNGSSTDGPFIYTGFRPKWVLIKCSSTSAQQWLLLDSTRSTYNVMQSTLFPDSNGPEQDNPRLDFLSNGFKIRNNYLNQNTNGDTYVYAAFAEFPFKFSNAR